MVDIEYIKIMLTPESEERKIKPGDFIPYNVAELLANGKIELFKRCFAKVTNDYTNVVSNDSEYTVELKCFNCGEIYTQKGSKTKTCKIIRAKPEEKICHKCLLKKKDEEKALKRKQQENYENAIKENTNYFIQTYLNVGYDFTDKTEKSFYALKSELQNVDADFIANAIKNMKYHDFLDTPYWKVIARHIKKRANNRCQLCNNYK